MAKSCIMYDGKPLQYGVVSWFGSFTGILSLFGIIYAFEFIPGLEDKGLLTDHWVVGGAAAFGAQSVLVYSMPSAPASQPWNCMVGSIISAFIGVSIRKIFVAFQQLNCSGDIVDNNGFDCNANDVRPDLLLLASALANSISIFVMHLTDSIHPPAGAFTYIAVNAGRKISSLGYLYLVIPVGIGCAWFVMWSWFVNKYIDQMVGFLFGSRNYEAAQTVSRNVTTGFTEHNKNVIPLNVDQHTERQDVGSIEQNASKTEKPVKPSGKPSNRKYPTGNGIGGWIRPLRKK